MKTIQQHIREVDVDRLIDLYLLEHPVKLFEIKTEELTIGEAKQKVRDKLKGYIERLRTIEIKNKAGHELIFYASKYYDDFSVGEGYFLVRLEDILSFEENIEGYSFVISKHEEIMGYKVADTELTQDSIYELLVYVMYEAAFFGYENEYLDDVIADLEEAHKMYKSGEGISFEDYDEFCEKCGIKKMSNDEALDELKSEVYKAIIKYNRYSQNKELTQIRELINKESTGFDNSVEHIST